MLKDAGSKFNVQSYKFKVKCLKFKEQVSRRRLQCFSGFQFPRNSLPLSLSKASGSGEFPTSKICSPQIFSQAAPRKTECRCFAAGFQFPRNSLPLSLSKASGSGEFPTSKICSPQIFSQAAPRKTECRCFAAGFQFPRNSLPLLLSKASGSGELNPGPLAPQASALPLSHSP